MANRRDFLGSGALAIGAMTMRRKYAAAALVSMPLEPVGAMPSFMMIDFPKVLLLARRPARGVSARQVWTAAT